MTPLRKRMVEDMELRKFAPKRSTSTRRTWRSLPSTLAKGRRLLGEEHVRQYLVHPVEERKPVGGTVAAMGVY